MKKNHSKVGYIRKIAEILLTLRFIYNYFTAAAAAAAAMLHYLNDPCR